MDTSKLKTFAQDARRILREQVEAKLAQVLAADSSARRESQTAVDRLETHVKESGRESVIDSVAYTWFNRFCALRYMDARGYTRVRIVSPSEGFTQPEILAEAKSGQFDDQLTPETVQARVLALLNGTAPSANPQSEAYRMLLVAACNSYQKILPSIFEHIADEIELLMPDDLLATSSVLSSTVETLTEDDCKDVEILGWLYQFYISERKDEVMARKKAVPTEDIPAVTQLFTPHWIVRYLVENSLGRLWMLNRPGSRLREQMPYYIEGEAETDFLKISKPEEIKLCDPACGSGHMLTYAFELFTLIYEEEGYSPTEIPALILKHNLFGLEICPRAAQLAELALVFKAREKSRRFFQAEQFVRPNIIELQNVSFTDGELEEYLRTMGIPARRDPAKDGEGLECPTYGQVVQLLRQFEEAKNFGSLIQPCLTETKINSVRTQIENHKSQIENGNLLVASTHLKVLRVLQQAETLTQRYHVVVANPPYMGGRNMNASLKNFVRLSYPEGIADLYACFLIRNLGLLLDSGCCAMVTLPSWMSLSSFEALRIRMLQRTGISTLINNGRGLWGSDFGSCAFVLVNQPASGSAGVFKKLFARESDVASNEELIERFFDSEKYPRYLTTPQDLQSVPGCPIAFTASSRMRKVFTQARQLSETADARKGLVSLDDRRWMKSWTEVSRDAFNPGANDATEALKSKMRWFPVNKGGFFRKWYGCNDTVIQWENDGQALKEFIVERYGGGSYTKEIRSEEFYFRDNITWGYVTIGAPSFRYTPRGFLFSSGGSCLFPKDHYSFLCGLLNSKVGSALLGILSPTLNLVAGDVGRIPVLPSVKHETEIKDVVLAAISLARTDWDNFETSWDFGGQPLLQSGVKDATLEASWRNWEAQSTAAIRRMQELETENNRLFIAAYGLEGELQPEVPEEQITLARADVKKDMAAFVSYAVGCMMGRYSLDTPGLILANAGDTIEDYRRIMSEKRVESGEQRDSPRSLDILVRDSSSKGETTDRNVLPTEEITFLPDDDNVIPILDGDWFPDDITERFKKFLKVTFGEQHFDENIRFLEESLSKDVRRYFLTDFYKNHYSNERAYGYKKRPIYWLFSSPKGTFNALIYMHRYRPDTVSVVLKYLRDFQTKLQAHKQHLQSIADSADAKKADKTKALKEITQLTKDLKELEDYERKVIYPLASERREIDLDDGVKHNYPLFGEALKKIPGLDAKEEE